MSLGDVRIISIILGMGTFVAGAVRLSFNSTGRQSGLSQDDPSLMMEGPLHVAPGDTNSCCISWHFLVALQVLLGLLPSSYALRSVASMTPSILFDASFFFVYLVI